MSVYILSKWKLIYDKNQHFEKLKYGASLFSLLFAKQNFALFYYLMRKKLYNSMCMYNQEF